jgi:hypothetical protein
MRWTLLLALLVWFSSETTAQYYVSGQEPFSKKWYGTKTEFGKILFTEGLDSLANVYAQYQLLTLKHVPISLRHTPQKFPVVLHGNSILSNGFVSWAPKRMELVTTPSLDASPDPWLLRLALHETRHVVQIDKLNNGFFKAGYYLFGEQSVGAALAFVPNWFLEGDAVNSETVNSNSGRGRQAPFYRQYLAHFTENNGNKFSYEKWRLGSYKDYIPDHYSFGYQMIGYTNYKYGSQVWSNALRKVYRHPFTFAPFLLSVKKDTGKGLKKLFAEVVSYYDTISRDLKQEQELDKYKILLNNKIRNDYVEYKFPHLQNESTLIALKTSLKQVPRLIKIDLKTGKETSLHTPGYIIQRVSYSNNAIYWSEYRAASRWEYLNYSEVWQFDLNTNTTKRISNKTRLFNPIEYQGNIAAVDIRSNGENYITVISKNGDIIKSIRLASSLEIKEICAGKDEEIVARCSSPEGTLLLRFRNQNTKPDTILGPVYRDISNLAYSNGGVLFTMTNNYREEIFMLKEDSKDVHRVSGSMFGLSNISVSYDNMIIAASYNKNGSVPVALHLDFEEAPVNLSSPVEPLFPISSFETIDFNYKLQEQQVSAMPKSKKHSSLSNLFHIHSWAPVYYNPSTLSDDLTEMYPGVTLISQNLTSTLISSVGYSYNITHGLNANFEWLGWYPKIMAGVTYGNNYGLVYGGTLAPNSMGLRPDLALQFKTRVRVPFTLSSGAIASELNLGAQFAYANTWVWDSRNNVYKKGLEGLEPYLTFYSATRMAHRDLRPKLGVYIYSGVLMSPANKGFMSTSSVIRSGVYLPGIISNHSLLLSGQFEHQDIAHYIRNSRLYPMRGYSNHKSETIYSGSIDYAFPIFYPDFPIGPLVYFKRFFGNIFSDNSWQNEYYLSDQGLSTQLVTQFSAGIEINTDINVLRMPYPFRVGYRVGYQIKEQQLFYDFILSFDFGNLMGYNSRNNFLKLNF